MGSTESQVDTNTRSTAALAAELPDSRAAGAEADGRAGRMWLGVAALVAAAAFWSLSGPLIKLLNEWGQGVSGVTIASYRSLMGGAVLLPWAVRRAGTLRRVHAVWPIGCMLAFTLMTASFVIANTMTAAANAIILQYTSPLWVFALSPLLLKEHARRGEGRVLLVAMLGVAVIFAGQDKSGLPGLLVALLSGFGYGLLTVLLRGLRLVDSTVVTCVNLLGSGLLLLAPVLWSGAYGLTGRQAALMAVLGIVQFGIPYVLFTWGLTRVAAQRAALIVLLEAVLNPLWTWLAVGEPVPSATWLGGPLILAGIGGWIVLTWRGSAARSTHSPVPPQAAS